MCSRDLGDESEIQGAMSSGDYNSLPRLNEYQARNLSVTCQYIDKMIGEMEQVLNSTASKAAFPKFVGDISASQRRTLEDYFARIRAQLERVLDGQGIPRPEPTIPASRAVFTALLTIDIAVEELRPSYMRGYGEVPPELVTELEGICGELCGLVSRVNQYLLQDAGQDLRQRLDRLEQTSAELELLAKIERVVTERGLVEFRSTIAGITDRLEDQSLEIAVFGRVSSGKSSLLNAILGEDILPVGVTPITAVPTRIRYRDTPMLSVWYAERLPETLDIARLAEFASEKGNPQNQKRVTRMVVHVPSARLREGVTLVDTPGLGSLATTGSAETLAYLPNCDLGVVLIDAGSTVTRGDLETIKALYQAGIPVQVLLSKADLLSADDRAQMLGYIRKSIDEEYRLDLPVHPVSAIAAHRDLLEGWFKMEILPLYERCRELKSSSIRRKVGALRDAVIAVLTIQIRRGHGVTATDAEKFREVEAKMRKTTGRISETRNQLEREIRGLERATGVLLERAALRLADKWASKNHDATADLIVFESILMDIHQEATHYRQDIESLAREAHSELESAARALGFPDGPTLEEFTSVIRAMPVFDFAAARNFPSSAPSLMRLFGKTGLRASARRLVNTRLEKSLADALFVYSGVLREWTTTVVNVIEKRFASFADGYRAQAGRAQSATAVGSGDQGALLKDVRELGGVVAETGVSVGSAD
jgi:GTP-binding protein EngB required for normal cell division